MAVAQSSKYRVLISKPVRVNGKAYLLKPADAMQKLCTREPFFHWKKRNNEA